MSFARRKALVEELRNAAAASAAEQVRHRLAIRRWKQQKLGSPGTLAWAFAAGSFWAAGHRKKGGDDHRSDDDNGDNRHGENRAARRRQLVRNTIGAVNTGILAWRVFGPSTRRSAEQSTDDNGHA